MADQQAFDAVTDPFLLSVLQTSRSTQAKCIELLELTEANPVPPRGAFPNAIKIQISREQKKLNSYLALLRNQHREAIVRSRHTKQETTEARQEVDKLHLQLQNLYYEQKHLIGEIAGCEAFDHKYRQLPLIPVEDFVALFPEHVGDDEDTLMRARINHENEERKALEQTRQELLRTKQSLIAENKKRKDDLSNLDNDLEKLIDAAKPVQRTFEKDY